MVVTGSTPMDWAQAKREREMVRIEGEERGRFNIMNPWQLWCYMAVNEGRLCFESFSHRALCICKVRETEVERKKETKCFLERERVDLFKSISSRLGKFLYYLENEQWFLPFNYPLFQIQFPIDSLFYFLSHLNIIFSFIIYSFFNNYTSSNIFFI